MNSIKELIDNNKKYDAAEKILEELLEDLLKSKERRKQMLANTEYVDWLYDFTKKVPKFSTKAKDYENIMSLSDLDYEKVKMLPDFFDILEKYNTMYKRKFQSAGSAVWYTIKYKDAFFDIGTYSGQGSFQFIERKDYAQGDYVHYESIMENKPEEILETKEGNLFELEKLLRELKSKSISYADIKKVVKKVYR